MLLRVVLVYDRGRKLSEKELRAPDGVVGDVRTQIVQINGKGVRQAVCMGGSKAVCRYVTAHKDLGLTAQMTGGSIAPVLVWARRQRGIIKTTAGRRATASRLTGGSH